MALILLELKIQTGLAVRSASAVLTISDAPAWQTAGGSVRYSCRKFQTERLATVSATGDTIVYSESTNVLTNASLANCTLNTSTGVISSTNFGGSATAATTYSFTLVATDAQNQASSRNFTISSSYGATGGGQFNILWLQHIYQEQSSNYWTINKSIYFQFLGKKKSN